jgi:hypothetical protein
MGLVVLIVVPMGVLAYYRYVQSENHFIQATAEMDKLAPTLDVEGCVDAVLDWHATCAANKPLCDHGVPMIMTHCLSGRDRSQVCESMDLSSAKAQWVFASCKDRGTGCRGRKKCACATAYRTLDSFCHHDQEGVAM